ncbi:MAG: adenosylmethionine--8-amino-7-oxononanoate transaminase [Proteobacteria bacterium]|nr:adenosylmethionine--8-amino-7-oxononanoate transaminase [Pseudomonadota bacterium]
MSDIRELDKKYIWHPFTQMKDWLSEEPLVIKEGRGSFLYDDRGNKYLDAVSSLWVNVHGHNNGRLNRAIKNQLSKIAHSTLLGLANEPSALLAERLVKILPAGLDKIFYSDNGSTSVEIALKMAFQYWQHKGNDKKTKFAYLKESYHGDTIGAVSVGGIDLFHSIFKPLLFQGFKLPTPYCYRCDFGREKDNCNKECLSKAKEILRTNKDYIAGLIMEPLVQGAAGMITHFDGFLKEIEETCKDLGILLILDEVATGFGRTGKYFACQWEEVTPDMICLAKGITGGYLPLAVTAVKEEIFNAYLGEFKDFKTFFHGHTYTGNPLACAVAIENLKLFEEKNLINRVQKNTRYLKKKLDMFNNHKNVGEIRQRGFMVGIEIVKDKESKEIFPAQDKVCYKISMNSRKYGVITRPLGNVLVMMPPLSIKRPEIDMMCEGIYKSLVDILGE